jgi:hypothetical protein
MNKMESAGAMGAEVGGKAATSYLASLDAKQKDKADVYEKMAALEQARSSKLQGNLDSVVQAGLGQDARVSLELNPEIRQAKVADAGAMAEAQARARAKYLTPSEAESAQPIPEADKLLWGQKLGIDPSLLKTKADLNRAVSVYREQGINDRRAGNIENQNQSKTIPGASIIDGVRPSDQAVAKAQESLKNYNALKEVYLPEMKRAFSNPNTTIEDKAATIANAVVAIKAQKGMGANFTALEESLVKAGLPSMAQISPSELTRFFISELQGQDALFKIKKLEELTDNEVEASIRPYGYTLQSKTSSSVPAVGQMFNGKKVLSVKRIQ